MDTLASAAAGLGVPSGIRQSFEDGLPELTRLAFRVAYSVLRNQEDAEDVAQEALLRAHRSLRSLRDEQRLRGWLVRIVWRHALDRQRAERRRASREWAVARSTTSAIASRQDDLRMRLAQSLERLPEKLRIVVVLMAINGYGAREVAGLLGIPEGTAKTRLRAARLRLAEMLE